MTLLLTIPNLVEGVILKRPSKYIKSPYVADIQFSEKSILGHTASLGCCGLADVGASVLMSPIIAKTKSKEVKDDKLHCEYRVYLSVIREKNIEIIIGIYPKLAEELVELALKKNLFTSLQNCRTYKKETTISVKDLVHSRFDFTGIDENGIPFIMEVKNVPLADYEDMTAKDRKRACFEEREVDTKVAYFPDGYRKKLTDTVSPRALKHISELALIKSMSKVRCIMCYVIQRTDVNRFQPSVIDPEYRNAFIEAKNVGVEIITMVVQWTKKGEAYFIRDDLPISIS